MVPGILYMGLDLRSDPLRRRVLLCAGTSRAFGVVGPRDLPARYRAVQSAVAQTSWHIRGQNRTSFRAGFGWRFPRMVFDSSLKAYQIRAKSVAELFENNSWRVPNIPRFGFGRVLEMGSILELFDGLYGIRKADFLGQNYLKNGPFSVIFGLKSKTGYLKTIAEKGPFLATSVPI